MHEQRTFDIQIAAPDHVTLSRDKNCLRLSWPDGFKAELGAAKLRSECRSSVSLRARFEERDALVADDLKIERVELVGSYALNLAFSDGEDRGIYPWRFLRELADTQSKTESS